VDETKLWHRSLMIETQEIMKRLPVIVALCFVVSFLAGTINAQTSSPTVKADGTRANPKPTPVRVHRAVQQQAAVSQPAEVPKAKSTSNVRLSYSDAVKRFRHERHDRAWWRQHFTTIVLIGGGYYYFDAGYWFPAWGYDRGYEFYEYDGPIYTYGNLLPDEVILNVQRALQEAGYFAGGLTGSLTAATRQAIANYQSDAGLIVNGIVDAPTVAALGLE
jgi:Putative peptidoglycan binding domain